MFQYLYMPDFELKVIKLDYYLSDMSMVIFLPDDYNGINNLEMGMESFRFKSIIAQMESYKVNLTLPKFNIEFDISLKDQLTQVYTNYSKIWWCKVINKIGNFIVGNGCYL